MREETVAALVPFGQTVLWVGLVGFALWRYHDLAEEILRAVKDRVIQGSSVKAGPIEIGERVVPQDTKTQRAIIKQEANELVENIEDNDGENSGIVFNNRSELLSAMFEAEDFAIRDIQSEYGVAVRRHVKLGSSVYADGVFERGNHTYIIEVKAVTKHSIRKLARLGASQLQHIVRMSNIKNAMGVLVLVDIQGKESSSDMDWFQQLSMDYPEVIDLRVLFLSDLRAQYGLAGE